MENPVYFVENTFVLEPKTCHLGGLSRTLKLWGKVYRWGGEANPSLWPGHGCERLLCNAWAEPYNVSNQPWYCCLSLRVEGAFRVVHGFLLQGFKQQDSGRWGMRKPWWRAELYASCKMMRCRGVMVPEHLPFMPYTHVTSGRVWKLGSVTFVSQSSACGGTPKYSSFPSRINVSRSQHSFSFFSFLVHSWLPWLQ